MREIVARLCSIRYADVMVTDEKRAVLVDSSMRSALAAEWADVCTDADAGMAALLWKCKYYWMGFSQIVLAQIKPQSSARLRRARA